MRLETADSVCKTVGEEVRLVHGAEEDWNELMCHCVGENGVVVDQSEQ